MPALFQAETILSEKSEKPKSAELVENVRQHVRAVIDEHALTQTSVAREAGISSATLSEFLAGRYGGNNTTVAAKLSGWLKALADRAAVPSALTGTPDFVVTTIAASILDAMDYARLAGNMVVVIGEPGVGKTTALNYYEETTNNVWMMTASSDIETLVPMLDELCISISIEKKPNEGAAGRRRSIEKKIKNTRGVLIVDEAQHLDIKAIEGLRSIHDRTRIGLVMAGHPDLEDILRKSPQANSRVSYRVVLKPPTRIDVIILAESVVGDALIFGDDEVAYLHTYAVLPGGLRWVVNILKMALYIRNGLPDIPVLKLLKNAVEALNIGETGASSSHP